MMKQSFEVLGNGPKALIAALEKNLCKKQLFSCGLAVWADEEVVNTIEIRQGTRMNGSTYEYIWVGSVSRD